MRYIVTQVIFRKGGIREPAFRPKEKEFYLFPNSFHSDGTLLKSEAAQRFSKVVHDAVIGRYKAYEFAVESLKIHLTCRSLRSTQRSSCM